MDNQVSDKNPAEAPSVLSDGLAALVEKWKTECFELDMETKVLRSASDIVGGDTLKHSIELWQMKNIRLQRCVIEAQHLMLTANAKLTGGASAGHETEK